MGKIRNSRFFAMHLAFAAALLCTSAGAARFEAGKGVANDRATGAGPNDVTFVTRGNGNAYGWRGWDMAIAGTILPWSIPNDESSVYGLRINLGWGAFANTYGLDAGAFSSATKDFGGIAANLCGNVVGGVMGGIQVGAVNIARGPAYGLQIAFVNFAEDLHGVQIGGLNFNNTGLKCFPILNVGF